MPLLYHLVERPIPGKPEEPKKFYASAVRDQQIDLTTLAKELAKQSTLSSVDIKACLESFIEQLPFYLMRGSIVRLGEFGSFYLNISSDGAPTEEDFDHTYIRGSSMRFKPAKRLGKILKDTEYEKVDR